MERTSVVCMGKLPEESHEELYQVHEIAVLGEGNLWQKNGVTRYRAAPLQEWS
jgi:hypothetical protein